MVNLLYRGVRRVGRAIGLGYLRRQYRRRYGWRTKGALAGYRLFDPMIVEYSMGITEPNVTRTISSVVEEGWTCVDVGAHKGYFSLLLAKLVGPSGRVISFEAHPENAAMTARHAKVNGVAPRVEVVNQAVSDGSQEEVTLYFGRDESPFEWNILGHDVHGRTTQAALRVPCTTLDAFFGSETRIQFLKMDIEGAEALALAGMRRILEECRPVMVVEFHNQEVWTACMAMLSAGYTLFDISDGTVVRPDETQLVHQCLVVPTERVGAVKLPWRT